MSTPEIVGLNLSGDEIPTATDVSISRNECTGDEDYTLNAVLFGALLCCYAVLVLFFVYLLCRLIWGAILYFIHVCQNCCYYFYYKQSEVDHECHSHSSEEIWFTAQPSHQHQFPPANSNSYQHKRENGLLQPMPSPTVRFNVVSEQAQELLRSIRIDNNNEVKNDEQNQDQVDKQRKTGQGRQVRFSIGTKDEDLYT